MDGTINIAELTQQHAPVLFRTADLIDCLRACTLFAATPQAARILLPNVGGNSPLFATALSTVANDGLDVLGDASTYFLDIQLTTRSIGSTLERLQQSFGKPEERITHERLLKRIVDNIENCTKGSKQLEEKLGNWRKQIKNFESAVQQAQAKVGEDAENTEEQIGTLNDEVGNEAKQLRRILEKEEIAREKYEAAKSYKRSLAYDFALPKNFDPHQIGWQVARYGWCWFWSIGASQELKDAQQEVEKRRQAAEEYEVRIADAQVQLAKMNSKVFELERYKKSLAQTLAAVTILSDNIRNLVVEFSHMGPYIKQLTQRNRSAGTLSNDWADEVAPGSEAKLFADDVHQMGQFALTVEHMAWVYGGLIERVLIGGMKNCNGAHDPDDFDHYLALMKPGGDRSQNSSVCSLLLTDVDASYTRKGRDLLVSHGRALEAVDKASKASRKKKKSKFSFRIG